MKLKKLLLIALVAGGFAFATAASSQAHVSIGFGFGFPISYGYGDYGCRYSTPYYGYNEGYFRPVRVHYYSDPVYYGGRYYERSSRIRTRRVYRGEYYR